MTFDEASGLYAWSKQRRRIPHEEQYVPLLSVPLLFDGPDAADGGEAMFAVSADYLVRYMNELEGRKSWSLEKARKWLEEQCTADETSGLFTKSCLDGECRFFEGGENT